MIKWIITTNYSDEYYLWYPWIYIYIYNNERMAKKRRKETQSFVTKREWMGLFEMRDLRGISGTIKWHADVSIIVLLILSSRKKKKNRRVIKENAQSGSQRGESKMKSLVAVVGGENDPPVMFAKTTVAISPPPPVASSRKSRQSITTHFSKWSDAADRSYFTTQRASPFHIERYLSEYTNNCTLQKLLYSFFIFSSRQSHHCVTSQFSM